VVQRHLTASTAATGACHLAPALYCSRWWHQCPS
jgi:hypothetical protein